MAMKVCKKCSIEKGEAVFYKQTSRADGLHPWCKECCLAYDKKNKQAKQERLRRWRSANPERVKEFDADYRKRHAEKRSKYNTQYHASRRKVDPAFRIAGNLRNRIRLIAVQGSAKTGLIKDLGCSPTELQKYLESKFLVGMSWANYGKNGWEIDHIQPLCSFDLTDPVQYKQACHYTNLQPLWKSDHSHKSVHDKKLSVRLEMPSADR